MRGSPVCAASFQQGCRPWLTRTVAPPRDSTSPMQRW